MNSFPSGDESWEIALQTVQTCLNVPPILSNLVRNCWAGIWDSNDFMRALGFIKVNPRCLLRAAELPSDSEEVSAADVERAVTMLGVRSSAVVVSINFVCNTVLKANPPERIWSQLFHEMMNQVEIGYRFGSRAEGIGSEGGMLMGFVRAAGLAILMAQHPKEYADWYLKSRGIDTPQLVRQVFGCESYQVGALALQQLGFGPEIATAAAVAVGNLSHDMLELPRHVITWKAAYHWIDALRLGKGFPRDLTSQCCFDGLAPPAPGHAAPPALNTLYAQIAQVLRNQSDWCWHLPSANYEETVKLMASRKGKGQNYATGRGTMYVETRS